jgi:hypothetical protein
MFTRAEAVPARYTTLVALGDRDRLRGVDQLAEQDAPVLSMGWPSSSAVADTS